MSFQVELKPGYYLEARPHAYTEDDKPVYTRTGKVAKKVFVIIAGAPELAEFFKMKASCIIIYNFKFYFQVPFPEDVVRCHAVMQALAMDLCHCVYANKTYTIGMKNSIEV